MKGGSYRRWTQTAATNQFEKAVRRGGSESNTRRVPLIHPWPANHVREEIRLFTLGLTRLVLSLFHHRGGRGQRARRGWIKSSPGETIAYFQSRDGLDCPPSIPVPASIMCPTPILVRSSSFRVSVFTYAVAESLSRMRHDGNITRWNSSAVVPEVRPCSSPLRTTYTFDTPIKVGCLILPTHSVPVPPIGLCISRVAMRRVLPSTPSLPQATRLTFNYHFSTRQGTTGEHRGTFPKSRLAQT